MKKLMLFTSFLLFTHLGFAQTGIAGSEITYKALPQMGTYELTLVLYRWCGGLPLCANNCGGSCTQTLQMVNGDNGASIGTTVMQLSNLSEARFRSTGCGLISSCSLMGCKTTTGSERGIERYEFKSTVNLGATSGIASSICNIRFVWSGVGRASDYLTINSGQTHYTFAEINRCASNSLFNSSPSLLNNPNFTICGGNQYLEDMGAIDYDLQDSLSFSFAPALSGFGTSVSYISPYTFNRPMPWTGVTGFNQIYCDPKSGLVSFIPPNTSGIDFRGIVTVEVKQWRTIGGVPALLGTIRREWDVLVQGNCAPNNASRLVTNPTDPINPNAPLRNQIVCSGNTLCFTITGKDTDFIPPLIADTSHLSWNESIKNLGATFLPFYGVSGARPREDVYQFCWTPHDSLARNAPYILSVNHGDRRCPSSYLARTPFDITVIKDPKPFFSTKTYICNNVELKYDLAEQTNGIVSNPYYQVANDTNDRLFANGFTIHPASRTAVTRISFSKSGKYFFRLVVPLTSNTSPVATNKIILDSIVIDTSRLVVSYSTESPKCFNDSSGKLTVSVITGTSPYSFSFNNSSFQSSNVFSQLNKGKFILIAKDNKGCETLDSITINEPQAITQSFASTKVSCNKGNNGSVTIQVQGGTPPYSYLFNQNSLLNSTVLGLAAGKYQSKIIDQNNCVHTDSVSVLENSAIIIQAKTTAHPCNGTSKMDLNAQGGIGSFKYAINDTNYQTSNQFTLSQTRNNIIRALDSLGCIKLDSVFITLPPTFGYSFTTEAISCHEAKNGSIQLTGKGSSTGNYSYKMGNGSLNTTGLFNNLDSGTYRFTITDDKGCIANHTEILTRPVQFIPMIIGNTNPVLAEESTYRLVSFVPEFGYKWSVSNGGIINGRDDSTAVNIEWLELGTQVLSVLVTYGNGLCKSLDSFIVIPKPRVSLNEVSNPYRVSIYPNPASKELTIELDKFPKKEVLQIQTIEGKILLETHLKQKQIISIEEFPQGLFIVKIGAANFRVVKY